MDRARSVFRSTIPLLLICVATICWRFFLNSSESSAHAAESIPERTTQSNDPRSSVPACSPQKKNRSELLLCHNTRFSAAIPLSPPEKNDIVTYRAMTTEHSIVPLLNNYKILSKLPSESQCKPLERKIVRAKVDNRWSPDVKLQSDCQSRSLL